MTDTLELAKPKQTNQTTNAWWEPEYAILREMWPTNEIRFIKEALHDRHSLSAISKAARRIGLEARGFYTSQSNVLAAVNPGEHGAVVARGASRKPATTTTAAPPNGPVSIMALAAHHCRWPIDTADGVKYCGARRCEPRVYCAYHARVAYQPMRR